VVSLLRVGERLAKSPLAKTRRSWHNLLLARRPEDVHGACIRREYESRFYRYLLLRRSYRGNGKVNDETLANLSHLPRRPSNWCAAVRPERSSWPVRTCASAGAVPMDMARRRPDYA